VNTTSDGTRERAGGGGTVNGDGVLVLGDVVVIERDGAEVARSRVEGLERFATSAREFRLGWGGSRTAPRRSTFTTRTTRASATRSTSIDRKRRALSVASGCTK
jgi:hypothetical protein